MLCIFMVIPFPNKMKLCDDFMISEGFPLVWPQNTHLNHSIVIPFPKISNQFRINIIVLFEISSSILFASSTFKDWIEKDLKINRKYST